MMMYLTSERKAVYRKKSFTSNENIFSKLGNFVYNLSKVSSLFTNRIQFTVFLKNFKRKLQHSKLVNLHYNRWRCKNESVFRYIFPFMTVLSIRWRLYLIQHCERSELRLHFWVRKSLLKMPKNSQFWLCFENLKLAVKQSYQTGLF